LEDKGYDTGADIFSAGVIMYVMLTGVPLFRGDGISDTLEKNKNCQLEFPERYWSKISREARTLVEGMLKKNPKERLNAK
jgi:serine/threonine protein kinase